jgi:hypothetical protein
VATAAAFLVVAFRVLSLAGYDPLTAKAIVQTSGTTNIALEGLIASAPTVFAGLFGFGASATAAVLYYTGLKHNIWWIVSGAIVMLLASFWIPWTLLALAVVGIVLSYFTGLAKRVTGRGTRVSTGSDEPSEGSGLWSQLSYLIVPAMVLVLSPPYLATESFSRAGHQPVTGYLLGTTDKDYVVLVDNAPRHIVNLAKTVTSHRLCDPRNAWWNQTLYEATKQSPYPSCPP